MFIGACFIKIDIPYSKTLKEKRAVVNSIKSKLKDKFNISVAEVDFLENKRTAGIGITMVSHSKSYINGAFEKALNFVNDNFDIVVLEEDFEIMKF